MLSTLSLSLYMYVCIRVHVLRVDSCLVWMFLARFLDAQCVGWWFVLNVWMFECFSMLALIILLNLNWTQKMHQGGGCLDFTTFRTNIFSDYFGADKNRTQRTCSGSQNHYQLATQVFVCNILIVWTRWNGCCHASVRGRPAYGGRGSNALS